MDKTVVVLGANSFSGQDFVDLLLSDPQRQVIGISRSPERSATFIRHTSRPERRRYVYHRLDLNRDLPEVVALLDRARPEAIVNFAAQSEVAPSWDHPEHWFQTNAVALAALVNALRRRTFVRKYVHISSPEVYGTCVGTVREDAPLRPSTPYAASKAAADMLLETYRRQFQLPVITVRATNVYGARQQLFKIIPRTAIRLKLGQVIELHGGGKAVKSFIHVRDVSHGERAILEAGEVGETYHLSPDENGVAVRDVVAMMCKLRGASFETATRSVAERPGQDAAYIIDSSKARKAFGWRPGIDLESGLREVLGWVDACWGEISALPHDYQHVS